MGINFEEIDPNMREIVRNFNKAGYITTNSCEGHISEDGYIMPYLTFKLPDDSTKTCFVLNNLSVEMDVSIRIPTIDKDLNWVEDENEIDGGYYTFLSQAFMKNHTVNDFEVGIYLNGLFTDEGLDVFGTYRKVFLDHLLELSRYLIFVNEVYKECC